MKARFFSIMASVALITAGFTSCSDNWDPDTNTSGTGKGQLRTSTLAVEVTNGELLVKDGASPSSRSAASRETIDLTNYVVTITDRNNDDAVVETWTYADMPELPLLNVGDYTVTVKSAEAPEAAGWNCPYFVGSQNFSIQENKITDVDAVVCKLANIRVTVAFTKSLLEKAGDDVKVEVRSTEGNSLEFTPETTDAGYFASTEDAAQTLRVAFTGTINGQMEDFAQAIQGVAAGQHRKITFGLTVNDALSPDELGAITVEGEPISVNTGVVEEDMTVDNIFAEDDVLDSSDRPGQEVLPEDPEDPDQPGTDPEDPDDPKEEVVKLVPSEDLDMDDWNLTADFVGTGKQAVVDIFAEKGLDHLYVTIESTNDGFIDAISDMSFNETFDLAHPSDEVGGYAASLGLPYGDQVLGLDAVKFDVTSFMPMLVNFDGEHKFTIKAVDQEGNENTAILRFK